MIELNGELTQRVAGAARHASVFKTIQLNRAEYLNVPAPAGKNGLRLRPSCLVSESLFHGSLPGLALGGFWGDPSVYGWVNLGKDG
jgi:hypothetical protein